MTDRGFFTYDENGRRVTDRPRRWDDCNGDPCTCPKPPAMRYDREALIAAIDKMHDECYVASHPAAYAAAQKVSAALGWTDPVEWPDGQWIRAALRKVFR